MKSFEMPFAIGDVKWQPSHAPEKVTIPCPECAGKLAVTVILGDGERVGVPCEACGLGFNWPRGVIEEWSYTPRAIRFEIGSVSSMHDDRWTVESTSGGWGMYHELCDTEEEALTVSRQKCAEQYESNMQSRQRHKKNVARAVWSVRYHREQIKSLTQQLEWHQAKVKTHTESRAGQARSEP